MLPSDGDNSNNHKKQIKGMFGSVAMQPRHQNSR